MGTVQDLAKKYRLKIHLDGARIFNAAVALKIPVSELTEKVDSVMFCLSKGLSAPVGSLVCGSSDFIEKARKIRKMVGGGMRQAGHLAAPGIIALNDLVERLEKDHENARYLAKNIFRIQGIQVDESKIKTNILFFKLKGFDGNTFLQKLEDKQIKILMTNSDEGIFRAVLHREVSKEQVETVIKTFKSILA